MKSHTQPVEAHKKATSSTLVDLINGLEPHADKTAFETFTDKNPLELSYGELYKLIRRLSSGLRQSGLKLGDTVLIAAANSSNWVVACLAVIYSGAVVVPVDPRQPDEALKHIVGDAKVERVFCDERSRERLRKLCPGKRLQYMRLDDETGDESWRHTLSRSQSDAPPFQADNSAIIFYTSGTTGMPKGVPLTHANILMQIDSVLVRLGLLKPGDRVLLPLPFYHVYPLDMAILGPLRMGLTIILPHSLTGPDVMRALKEGKATVLVSVPGLLRAMHSGIEARLRSNKLGWLLYLTLSNLSIWSRRIFALPAGKLVFQPVRHAIAPSLRLFCCGGAPLEGELAEQLIALGFDIAVGYGLTETAPLLCMRMPSNRDLNSVGQPIPGVKVRITKKESNQEGEQSDRGGKEGEIEALGRNVFSGYLELPDKTAEAFSEDGWFKTGDLGYFQGNNLRITGRASSLLVMEGGKKVQPDSLEQKLSDSEAIREAAVLVYERKLVALVVPRLSKENEGDEQIALALQKVSSDLPSYLRIADFAVSREPLPRTNLGKLKRHELEERYTQAKAEKGKGKQRTNPISVDEMSEEDASLLEDGTARATWEWLCEQFLDSGLTMDTSPQLDLNVDSLEWMNLSLELKERTGVELGEDAIARVETVRDLVREAAQSSHSGQSKASPLQEPGKYLPREQSRWLQPLRPWQRSLAHWFFDRNHELMRSLFKVDAIDADKIPNGQAVFIPNHASYCDAFALAAALDYDRLKRTYWAGWTGISFGNPLFRFGSRLAKVIPIDAKKSLISSLALGAAVLKRHKSLVWFPEGERTLDGELLKFKSGIGIILAKYDVPVVPVYLDGTREALPPGSFFPHPSHVRVIFGDPVTVKELKHEGDGKTDHERIANALKDRVQALSRRAQHGK